MQFLGFPQHSRLFYWSNKLIENRSKKKLLFAESAEYAHFSNYYRFRCVGLYQTNMYQGIWCMMISLSLIMTQIVQKWPNYLKMSRWPKLTVTVISFSNFLFFSKMLPCYSSITLEGHGWIIYFRPLQFICFIWNIFAHFINSAFMSNAELWHMVRCTLFSQAADNSIF